jgi:hypothetical protein
MPGQRVSARENLARLDAAIVRTLLQIDAMEQQWRADDAPCCPGCMFGAQYREAEAKLERQKAWRAILAKRVEGAGQ